MFQGIILISFYVCGIICISIQWSPVIWDFQKLSNIWHYKPEMMPLNLTAYIDGRINGLPVIE